jgi:hypothetical protein
LGNENTNHKNINLGEQNVKSMWMLLAYYHPKKKEKRKSSKFFMIFSLVFVGVFFFVFGIVPYLPSLHPIRPSVSSPRLIGFVLWVPMSGASSSPSSHFSCSFIYTRALFTYHVVFPKQHGRVLTC